MITTNSIPLRSTGTAYLWWFCLGSIGAHQFYLGRPWRGILYAALCMLCMFAFLSTLALPSLIPVLIGMLLFLAIFILMLWDLFTLPSQVRAVNGKPKSEYEHF